MNDWVFCYEHWHCDMKHNAVRNENENESVSDFVNINSGWGDRTYKFTIIDTRYTKTQPFSALKESVLDL